MSATLTNAGSTTCTITQGAEQGFSVSKGSSVIWTGGCDGSAEGHSGPEACPAFEELLHLAPGQTLKRSQKWAEQSDATSTAKVAQVGAGSYVASEAWAGQTVTAPFTIS